MNIKKYLRDIASSVIFFIISCFFVFDLFINKGQPVTFDGPTHIMNIAMFFKSMNQGLWHVTWTDGFANYGMPIGLIAQQVTSYLGGIMTFLTHNPVTSYNLVLLIGTFLSTLFFYFFLRLYFKPESSFVTAVFFHFAPYRIINIYIRGSIPEYFGSVFLPLMLIGMYYMAHKKQFQGFLLVTLSSALLILTHPMMVIIYGFIVGFYFLFLCHKNKNILQFILLMVGSCTLGFGLTGYYSIPLNLEIKYFYYGLTKNHADANQFLTLANYIDPRWYYFYKNDVFPRGNFLKAGLPETIVFVSGILYAVIRFVRKRKLQIDMLLVAVVSGIVLVAMTTKPAFVIFTNFNFLSNIQHQWRLLSSFIYIPPIILAYFLDKWNNKWLMITIIILMCVLRYPQLYGKNYIIYPQSHYYFNPENLHAVVMNTVWTGPTQDYPIEKDKGGIIGGKGTILSQKINDVRRTYIVRADSNIRMADYTFYFPGWRVYVDNVEAPIQFQDPAYRGVITYNVPSGNHTVQVKFTNTKVRLLGILVTFGSLLALGIGILFRRKISIFKL